MSAEFLQRVMDAKRIEMSLLGDAVRESVRDAALAARQGRKPRFRERIAGAPNGDHRRVQAALAIGGRHSGRSRSRRDRAHL